MNFQLKIQAHGSEMDTAIRMVEKCAAIVSATVDRDEERCYVALVPRPEGTEVAA